ncbi:MAG: S8 family peptidase [Candidatus Eremiobacteraeota bacterium]|nr:S8 family peptidase [Candidatus Eremiobacteraeota bacterium]
MNDPVAGRVTQPLYDLATNDPAAFYHIVVRVRTDPNAPVDRSYDGIAGVLGTVATAIAAIANPPEGVVWNGAVAQAPFLYAKLTGTNVLALDRNLDGALRIEIRRDKVIATDAPPEVSPPFDPGDLTRRLIAEPLASAIRRASPLQTFKTIVVLDASHPLGQVKARETVIGYIATIAGRTAPIDARVNVGASHPYVYATMNGAQILALVELDQNPSTGPVAINRIWEDHAVSARITRTIATVKADAAQIAYSAGGKGIVWAVLDSGIDGTHPHFAAHENLKLDGLRPLRHRDFLTADRADGNDDPSALEDPFGHGTHVAGIIAGTWRANGEAKPQPTILCTTRDEAGADVRALEYPPVVTGMAPECKLVSMRVLDKDGSGNVSSIIDAFEAIQQLNGYGRRIVVHGVNLSAGYAFDAKWFGCGASPLCDEVDRLVRSGVVVVVAAGNSGYGTLGTSYTKSWAATLAQTINDPGNADLAITVGSTHRSEPHTFGVSYFSSKGPTGDGRMKPDLVAPGERIVSCASAQARTPATVAASDGGAQTVAAAADYTYREDSGTSMAAPHVSGVVAAFLSIRTEFIGQPETVKELFVANATDLRRDKTFQGSGLVDLMRTIQAV